MVSLRPLTFSSGERPRALWALLFKNIQDTFNYLQVYIQLSTEREQIIRYKFKWSEADIDPTDNKLNKDEFLAFRHPEQSSQALGHMVRAILESLGRL